MQNLYDSHDSERLATHIINPEIYLDTYVSANNNKEYNLRKPNSSEIQKQKLLALIQMTSLGAPMIYYGTEAGMWGADDPDERKPMVWPELIYENESHHPFGKERTDDTVIFNTDLFNFYKKIITIRNETSALRLGTWKSIIADDAKNVLVFKRVYKKELCIVAINNSKQEQLVTIELNKIYEVVELLSDKTISKTDNKFDLKIPPVSGLVLVPVK